MRVEISMGKKDLMRNVITIVFLIVIVVLSIFLYIGVDFTTDTISKPEFWTPVLLNMVCTLLIFNFGTNLILDNIKHTKEGKYFNAYSRFAKYVYRIKNNAMYDKLDKAVETYNEELKKQAYEHRLFYITDKITYERLGDYNLEENPYKLSPRELKRLAKLQGKYIAGTLKYPKMKAEYITKDKVLAPGNYTKSDMNYNRGLHKVIINAIKIGTTLIAQIVMAVVVFNPTNTDIFQILLKQSFLFLLAIISAFSKANTINNATISNLNEKSDWCKRFGLGEEVAESREVKDEKIMGENA